MNPPTHVVTRLVVGLLSVGSLALALHGAPAHAAAARDDTEVACTTNTWSNLPDLDLGRVTPGSTGAGTVSFVVPGGGTVSASIADGADAFRVGSIETDTITKQRVGDDPGEMPPGYHGPRFHYETVCALDTSVDGSGPITAQPGEMVQIHVVGLATGSDFTPTGTLEIALDGATQQVTLRMFVGAITASLDAASLSIPQGRSGDIPVTVTSLGGPDADASFTLNDPVPGIAVTNPDVHVPSGATVHATLHIVVSRDAPLGDHPYGVAVSAFGGRQALGLGWLTITVTPLPIQRVTIPLGLAKTIWDQARDAACERIKDLTGQEVLAYYGRTLRDPHCYLAPLQLTATKTGDALQVTGTAIRSWVDLKLTTPDGIPRDLDPMFTVYFDVHVSIAVQLPGTLDGMSMLRVSSATVDLQNVYIDSDNATGDLIEALAKAFGGSAYFHPAEYTLGNLGVVVDAVNSALSQLDGALKAAPMLGFTQIDFTLDPSTLDLTVTFS